MHDELAKLFGRDVVDRDTDWLLNCPFHSEKSASFFIHKEDLICHCFGCGKAGRLEKILAEYTGKDVTDIRNELGINLLRTLRTPKNEPKYFSEMWLKAWPRLKYHPYLEKRGFTPETTQHFQARWDKANRRITFPLYSRSRLVGATGRAVSDKAHPKWYHYWNCKKSQVLFGVNELTNFNRVIITEGIFDVMWLWQAGWSAVGLLGSKASQQQIREIKSIASSVVVALDNDTAGEIGTEHLVQRLKTSCAVEYVDYPKHIKDVCELDTVQLEHVLSQTKTPLEKLLSARH